MDKLLEVNNLTTHFNLVTGNVRAVEDVSFYINKRETLGVVGESGCGKSVTARSVMGLIERPGKIVQGNIHFEGKNLVELEREELRQIRGNEISMIFQEPMTSFNQLYSIERQIGETITAHMSEDDYYTEKQNEGGKAVRVKKSKKQIRKEIRERILELLRRVHIPSPEDRIDEFPFQMSGGMLQRVMIAMALINSPKLLIADEPTTALDVTIQAQIMALLQELKSKIHMSMMFITHDLGLVAGFTDRVLMMYAGQVVETSATQELFEQPKHPYTQDLLKSIPRLGFNKSKKRLYSITGNVPDALNFPSGCRFHPRCKKSLDICDKQEPPLFDIAEGMKVKCWLYKNSK